MGTDRGITPADVLSVFDGQDEPGAPLTAPEVAEALDCARRTAHKKLTALADREQLATKKVGARGRVWWRPERSASARTADRADAASTVEQTTPDRGLRELHDASRRLMRAETHDTVAEVAVEAAHRILGLSLSGLWLYDPDEDLLEPVAWTDQGVEEYGEPPPFPVDESLVGRAFREGEFRIYDDITEAQGVYDPDTRVRSELILPLGAHGVLNASSPAVGAFDEMEVSLGRILAAAVETALDRADRLEERRARRRELERRRDELATLNRINALVEETIAALVGVASREEIERTVCERLVDSDLYVDAWIVERGSTPGSVAVRTGAGEGRAGTTLDGLDGAVPGPNPASTAITDGAVQTVPRMTEDERLPDDLRQIAIDRGARSCLVAPLSYADTAFGALVVHAPDPGEFSARERTAFETLGRVVGFVVNATNNRQLLLGHAAFELEVAVPAGDAWFVEVADRLGVTLTVEGLVPVDDGALVEYVAVEGLADDEADALLGATVFDAARILASRDGRQYVECRVRAEDATLRPITEFGGAVRRARATGDGGQITARFPMTTAPREAMNVIRDALPGTELVAKRVVDVSDRSPTTIRGLVDDRLTDKQRTALRAAFLAGYYDTPRGTTGQDLAASLEIAPSTLHQHLQAAQRKLLSTVFEEA